MDEVLQFVTEHGGAVVFVAVFIEQLGVPLPATPWLLAAGKINLFVAIVSAAFGFDPGRRDLVLPGTIPWHSRGDLALPHFVGTRLVRWPHAKIFTHYPDARHHRREIQSGLEHGRAFANRRVCAEDRNSFL